MPARDIPFSAFSKQQAANGSRHLLYNYSKPATFVEAMAKCQDETAARPGPAFIVATRYYRTNKSELTIDLTPLTTFSKQFESSDISWFLMMDASDTALMAAAHQWHQKEGRAALAPSCSNACTIVPIADWGHIVAPLNKALALAMNAHYKYIIYQSLEVIAAHPTMLYDELIQHADEAATLVVGYGFPGSHECRLEQGQSKAQQELTGLTCPWNTLALWSTTKLFRTGFLATLPEGNTLDRLEDFPIGVEEASVIAIQQAAWPASSQAKLVFFPSHPHLQARWHVHDDPDRRLRHASKMASKLARTRAHLSFLALSPTVDLIQK